MRQVEHRHKAAFGAVGLGMAQSWFWSRHKASFRAVGLGLVKSRFWSRHKAGFGAVGLGWAQSRFWSRHKAGFGAAGYITGFVSRQVLHFLSKLQNWISPKTGQYKTRILSNTKIDACTRATKPKDPVDLACLQAFFSFLTPLAWLHFSLFLSSHCNHLLVQWGL